jgi:hypothetical protein
MDINWRSMKLKHKITVIPSDSPNKSFLLSCACGNLVMDVVEEDVGRLIRIHWDVINQRR